MANDLPIRELTVNEWLNRLPTEPQTSELIDTARLVEDVRKQNDRAVLRGHLGR